MTEVLTFPPFIIFACITLVVVVPAICHYWWKIRSCEMETQLKRELVKRGLTVDEIVRIVQATATADEKLPDSEEAEAEPASV